MEHCALPITDKRITNDKNDSWEESSLDSIDDYDLGSTEESLESSVEFSLHAKKRRTESPVDRTQASTTDLKSDATMHLPMQDSSSQLADEPESEDEEIAQVMICSVSKKSDGKRVYDKKQYCLFCRKPFTKISRHLEQKHSKEAEVASAIGFPKNSKERRLQLELLRNRGNLAHNSEVLRTGEGNLVPCKRPTEEMQVQAQDFAPCTFCQGLFTRKLLWRHVRMCKFRPSDLKPRPGKNRVLALCAQPVVSTDLSSDFQELLSQMTLDQISIEVKNDKNIMRFGQQLYSRLGSTSTKDEYIRQKMRELGRLLLSARKVSKNLKSLNDLIKPANFMQTVMSVRDAAGCMQKTNTYKIPSLALKLGHSLTKISAIVERKALMEGDLDSAEAARQFRQIYDAKWNELVSAAAYRTLEAVKWDSPLLLPFTEDVKILHSHLDDKSQEYYKALSTHASTENWANLSKVTLTKIILFNRQRGGEVSKILLTSFILIDPSEPHPEIKDALSSLERKLCNRLQRVEIRDKRGGKVALLLTPDMCKSLQLLVEKRDACGVEKDNPYLFARPAAMSCYRASDCMRYFARACGAKCPDNLCSPKLQRQVGILSKVLNLTNTEFDQLAGFLGFNIQIHRQFHRLPEGTLQLAKISKVLLAFESGQLAELQGKTLDDINIHPDEKVVEEDVNDEMDAESGSNGMSFLKPHVRERTTTSNMLQSEPLSQSLSQSQSLSKPPSQSFSQSLSLSEPPSQSFSQSQFQSDPPSQLTLQATPVHPHSLHRPPFSQCLFQSTLQSTSEAVMGYPSTPQSFVQSLPPSQSSLQSTPEVVMGCPPTPQCSVQSLPSSQSMFQSQSTHQSTTGVAMGGPSTPWAPQGTGRRKRRQDQGQLDSFESSAMSIIQQSTNEEELFLLSLAPRLRNLSEEKRRQVKKDFLTSLLRAEFSG
ncbi:hypothetical protein ACEWY4_011043 [Coilia grayii]|uniref:BESS domain-containing protein n=1 Tax=Coilia grayii TaxID=363190 RepID=A0ABD1K3L1_9TELE